MEKERDEIHKDLRLIESRNNQSKDDKTCEDLGELGRKKCKYIILHDILHMEIKLLTHCIFKKK